MKEMINTAQLAIASLGGAIGAVLGGWDGFLYALVLFVVVDYITGIMAAYVKKKLSSQIGFQGILKKIVIFCLVAVGYVIDAYIIKNGAVVRTAVIFFYMSNEGISIMENAAVIGLPVPEKLRDVLEQLKDKVNGEDNS